MLGDDEHKNGDTQWDRRREKQEKAKPERDREHMRDISQELDKWERGLAVDWKKGRATEGRSQVGPGRSKRNWPGGWCLVFLAPRTKRTKAHHAGHGGCKPNL